MCFPPRKRLSLIGPRIISTNKIGVLRKRHFDISLSDQLRMKIIPVNTVKLLMYSKLQLRISAFLVRTYWAGLKHGKDHRTCTSFIRVLHKPFSSNSLLTFNSYMLIMPYLFLTSAISATGKIKNWWWWW